MEVLGIFSVLGLLLIRFSTNSRILYGMAQVDQVLIILHKHVY